ncbi:MAG: ATP-dependent DNA helicase [Patescibacteria group bacterium]
MISKKFKLLYNKLNVEQKKAVDTVEGPVMVIAGPGTGKTQILILRIAKILLETQVEPENILALTFTESAVYEMRDRLVSLIGTAGYRVEINTFHGFCNKLIQHHSEEFEDLIAAENIEELQQIQIIENILEKGTFVHVKPFGAPFHYAKSLQQTIGELKKEGVDAEKLSKAIELQEKDLYTIDDLYNTKGLHKGKMKGKYTSLLKKIKRNRELLTVYEKYNEFLSTHKKYDYNDMLLRVIKAFETNSDFLLRIQELYQYFLVDEHQDTNKAQNKIVEYLCNYYPNPNLFVVGDEAQAIFRFQGATLENFLYFKDLYKGALLINLSKNYRSSQKILDAATSLIDHNSTRTVLSSKTLFAQNKQKEESLRIAKLSTFFAEYYFIGQEIKSKVQKGINPDDIAIIVRNNKDIQPLFPIFEQFSIPYNIESDQDIFQDLTIEKILSLFKAIDNLGSDAELFDALYIDIFGIDPIDIYKLVQFAKDEKSFLWDVLSRKTYLDKVTLQNQSAIDYFVENLKLWKQKSMNDSFDNVFISVLNESGFMKRVLSQKENLEKIEKISTIYTEIKKNVSKNHLFNLHDFMSYVGLLKEHHITPRSSTGSIFRRGVHLMTAHKAKGREFDYVYIINAYDGHWGNKRKDSDLFLIPWQHLSISYDTVSRFQENEDERRLFYVAITRSRKQVTISYSSMGLDGKEQVVSQFVEEIHSLHKKEVNTIKFETDIAEHPEIYLNGKKPYEGTDTGDDLLLHKDFFNSLFIRRGLSVSGLNNYLSCPWKYFFRNLLLIPDVKNKNLIFGSAIHMALNTHLTNRGLSHANDKWVIDQYRMYLQKQPLSEAELEELAAKGDSVLSEYLRERAPLWKSNIQGELEIKGIRFTDDIFLNGKLDMIERLDTKGDVVVYDFKTGKPKSRPYIEGTIKTSNGDYKRQLVFYKILLENFKEGKLKMRMKEGVIEFVEKDDGGRYQSERFIITDKETEDLKGLILKVAREIRDLSFVIRRCDDPLCHYCKLRSYMIRE